MSYRNKIIIGVIIAFNLIIIFGSYYIVAPGYTALQIRFGSIVNSQRVGGLYFKMPFIDEVVTMPNGIIRASIETHALSKDLQAISVGVDVNYRYINEIELYKSTRGMPEQIILIPFCHESIKAVISQYTAEELIHKRHEAKDKIFVDLKERLIPHYIDFIEVNFAHADFSDAFMHAVENKQIAQQESMMAQNLTEKVREKAIQTKLTADADAYAQQVKKQSATKELAQLKAIEKWNGVLPKYITGTIPFISLEN